MIPELGAFFLVLSLSLVLFQISSLLIGALSDSAIWINLGRRALYAHAVAIIISFALLSYCFATNDFTVKYVSMNSNTLLPLQYRLSAVWGAHEGSLLLWIMILSIWIVAFSLFSSSLPKKFVAWTLIFAGIISLGFILFCIFTSNPFIRQIPPPANGADLNPLLQDFGLIIHPPMLYMGYVGFAISFCCALASLMLKEYTNQWAVWAKNWTLLAWSFLTMGIALGSWWAYYELGWGGWWFWDPVENASLMPWLVGTALIHSLNATAKREVFSGWSLLLAISAFGLSLLGTFLVRSGVLTSVHAFATDPARGIFILLFIVIVVGGAFLIYGLKASQINDKGYAFASRESYLLLNSVVLSVVTATILLGTLYPLAIDALNLGKISVGPPYFNAVVIPIMAPLMIFLGIAPLTRWHRDNWSATLHKLKLPLLGTAIFSIALTLMLVKNLTIVAVIGLVLSVWVIATSLTTLLSKDNKISLKRFDGAILGRTIAHIGFAICVIGITLVSYYESTSHLKMGVGDEAQLSNYNFKFASLDNVKGPNYKGVQAIFEVTNKGQKYQVQIPAEKRFYDTRGMTMTEAGIDAGLLKDIYISLGEEIGTDAWSVRLNIKPFVRFIWLGAILMAIGGLVAMGVTPKRAKP